MRCRDPQEREHDFGPDGRELTCRRCTTHVSDLAGPCPGEESWWPKEFAAAGTRAGIIARDTVLDEYLPRCWVCGDPIRGAVEVHHRLFKSRGGDARPSNGICVHDDYYGECHKRLIHRDSAAAALAGWAISRHSRLRPDQVPVRHAWRRGPGGGDLWLLDDDYGITEAAT